MCMYYYSTVIIMALPRNLMTTTESSCVIQKVTSYEKVADIKASWKINFVFLFFFHELLRCFLLRILRLLKLQNIQASYSKLWHCHAELITLFLKLKLIIRP